MFAWISAVGIFYWFKWLSLLGMTGGVLWLHQAEHARVRELLQKIRVPDTTARPVVSLLTLRSLYILILLLLLIIIVIAHDIRSVQPVAEATPVPVIAALPAPVAPATPPATPTHSENDLLFSDVPMFTEKNASTQAYLDLIKQRYEKLFVTYYFLLHCQAADNAGFATLQSALQSDLADVKAPTGTAENIMQAAKGTYVEIYARSACDKSNIASIKQSLEETFRQLAARRPKSER